MSDDIVKDVKRYTFWHTPTISAIQEDKDGQYVYYGDYEKLLDTIEELQEENKLLKNGNKQIYEDACLMRKDNEEQANKITKLEEEIDILRRYGNKDCTAMADEALSELGGE